MIHGAVFEIKSGASHSAIPGQGAGSTQFFACVRGSRIALDLLWLSTAVFTSNYLYILYVFCRRQCHAGDWYRTGALLRGARDESKKHVVITNSHSASFPSFAGACRSPPIEKYR